MWNIMEAKIGGFVSVSELKVFEAKRGLATRHVFSYLIGRGGAYGVRQNSRA